MPLHHEILSEGEDDDPTEEVCPGEEAEEGEPGHPLVVGQLQLGGAEQQDDHDQDHGEQHGHCVGRQPGQGLAGHPPQRRHAKQDVHQYLQHRP